MSRQERIRNALRTLKEDAPEYYATIMGDCPSDLGLHAQYRKWCGMESATAEFTSEYCDKCWRKALGEES